MIFNSAGWFIYKRDSLRSRSIAEVFRQARSFFALNESAKLKSVHSESPLTRGYTSLGQEHFRGSALPDHKEFLSWGLGDSAGNLWPETFPLLEENSLAASQEIAGEARESFGRNALAAGVALETVEGIERSLNPLFRLVHYPGGNGAVSGEHADLSLVTTIVSDSRRGLQIRTRGGWEDVAIPEGHAAVLAGELLEILSGGKITAAVHRVRTPAEARISLTCFLYPHNAYTFAELGATGDFLRRRIMELGIHERR
jgi:isopenicillin N synthase-like dioxygenase